MLHAMSFFCVCFLLTAKYLRLKKFITILLLTHFLVFQYARQFSYWECRLSNYFNTENEKCDCEKLVKAITGQAQPSPTPIAHNHFHLDESFYPSFSVAETGNVYINLFTRFINRNVFINTMIPGRLDHPPQNC